LGKNENGKTLINTRYQDSKQTKQAGKRGEIYSWSRTSRLQCEKSTESESQKVRYGDLEIDGHGDLTVGELTDAIQRRAMTPADGARATAATEMIPDQQRPTREAM
jgi:hypothetical protein